MGGRSIRRVVIFLTLLPLLTSNVVGTFAWIVLLGREGPLVAISNALGLTHPPTTFMFSLGGLVLAQTQIVLPLLVLPLIAVMSRLDSRLVRSGGDCGRRTMADLCTVLLPLALPGYIAGWILSFASATTNFVTQTTIGGARNVYLPQFVYRAGRCALRLADRRCDLLHPCRLHRQRLLALAMLARHPRLVGNV